MRRHRPEEHDRHEAWAIPYGDLITLLLAFFVVMYAVSSVNEGKYRLLSDALNAEFRGQPTAKEPIQIGTKQRSLDGDTETDQANNGKTSQPIDESEAEARKVAQTAKETAAQLNRVANDVEATMG